jgi:soluble lytic murein transglycosylase-like protein
MLDRLLRLLLITTLLLSGVSGAYADCFDDAAAFHRVNPTVLRAIAIVESGGKASAVNHNGNGSVDYGEMQINSIHLPELAQYGMSRDDLFDGCKSVYTGAWLLRKSIDKNGNTWAAIGAYHSATPIFRDQYAAKVKAIAERLLQYYGQ